MFSLPTLFVVKQKQLFTLLYGKADLSCRFKGEPHPNLKTACLLRSSFKKIVDKTSPTEVAQCIAVII